MKSLVNPLLWFLLLQTVGLYMLLRRLTGRNRIILWLLLILTLLLLTASTPLAMRGLEASLQVASSPESSFSPAYIFVLGGGYLPGSIPEEDVLVVESQRRVLHAVMVWRRFPDARMVFSGASYEHEGARGPDRLPQLMAETARNKGVPASVMLLEPRSRNTREHPVEALKLPGITTTTPIGLVTSGLHMRRAQREFCRYFNQVIIYPAPPMQHWWNWQDLLPDADTLDANTTMLREWVGLLWYAILGYVSAPLGKESLCRP
ncbi:MAG: YdcF family protein [Chloroflexota bacterium]